MTARINEEAACTRCGMSTEAKLDGVALCDECYSVFGACCASEFEDDDVLCKKDKRCSKVNIKL